MSIPKINPNTKPFPSLGQPEAEFEENTNHLLSTYMPQFESDFNNSVTETNTVYDDINIKHAKVVENTDVIVNIKKNKDFKIYIPYLL